MVSREAEAERRVKKERRRNDGGGGSEGSRGDRDCGLI